MNERIKMVYQDGCIEVEKSVSYIRIYQTIDDFYITLSYEEAEGILKE